MNYFQSWLIHSWQWNMGMSVFDLWPCNSAAVLNFGVSALKSDEVYTSTKKMYKLLIYVHWHDSAALFGQSRNSTRLSYSTAQLVACPRRLRKRAFTCLFYFSGRILWCICQEPTSFALIVKWALVYQRDRKHLDTTLAIVRATWKTTVVILVWCFRMLINVVVQFSLISTTAYERKQPQTQH